MFGLLDVDITEYLYNINSMRGNYEERKVKRTELNNGIIVDTCYTIDAGYETAIANTLERECKIVENHYPSKAVAIKKHNQWVKTVKKLGWQNIHDVGEEEFIKNYCNKGE